MAVAVAALTLTATAASASTREIARSPYFRPVPTGWHAPLSWLGHPSRPGSRATGAWCIHEHEGAFDDNTGNTYFGGLQMLPSTWYSVGGPYEKAFDHPGDPRYPFAASPREQMYRAYLIWKRDGGWFEWGSRGLCDL